MDLSLLVEPLGLLSMLAEAAPPAEISWGIDLGNPQTYVSLLVLAALEIVLGIDNIIFITILAGRLPPEKQRRARQIGLGFALVSRILLLMAISWVIGLTKPLFTIFGASISGKDLVLILGGLFLLAKATHEIHENVARPQEHQPKEIDKNTPTLKPEQVAAFMRKFIIQVIILDVVFSLDSVITAVGMANSVPVMITAVMIAVVVMMVFAGAIGDFVQKHATIRVLALSFLVLIGVLLVAEGFGTHVNKGYVYFAMAFSLIVELLNMRMRSRSEVLLGEDHDEASPAV